MKERNSWVINYLIPVLCMILLFWVVAMYLKKHGLITPKHAFKSQVTSIFPPHASPLIKQHGI